MKVVFDFALDGPAWPGALGTADHVYGETWVGPQGLIDLLETQLGLGGQQPSPLHRACVLVGHLKALSGFWGRSFEVDPLATARRLLRDRDELSLWGWTGQAFSPRLGQLHEATREVPPSLPDRLQAIVNALKLRRSGVSHLITHTATAAMPFLWSQVFQTLERAGVAIEERQNKTIPALGDLGAARTAGFSPTGDGRLCLLRRHGPLDVADEVAAALARCNRLDDVVIVAGDSLLDQALTRHGLPRLGTHMSAPSSTRLLPLVLATAFTPMEMGDLHALLAADPGPVARPVARRLLGALRESPGRRTPNWTTALAEGLALVSDERRAEVAERVEHLLMPVVGCEERIAMDSLERRLKVLGTWARARAEFVPSLVGLSQRIQDVTAALALLGQTAFTADEIRRLCDDAGEVQWTWADAQAGLANVRNPGALLGPARTVIWWNFSRVATGSTRVLPLSNAELAGFSRVWFAHANSRVVD